MERRAFIHTLGAAAAGGLLAPSLRGSARQLQRIGLELYAVRHAMARDPERTLDDWREWADRFNAAGAIARRAGVWLAFHNEADHMTPIDGTVPYDVFVGRLQPSLVRLQLDVGNMVMGGGDPMRYLEKYRDLYWTFHLKDVVADRSSDVELGRGVFDFKRFLSAVPAINDKPCYVEQEGAADELAAARSNFQYLRRLDF